MERLAQLWRRLRCLLDRDRLSRELEEEMQFHLDMKAAERGAQAARRQFGNVTLLKEDSREAWAWTSVERFLLDVRYAGRMLLKNPAFTVVAVLALALGIGANTAVFSVVNAVVFRSLPFQDPDRLMLVREIWENYGEVGVTTDNFRGWQQQSRSFERLAAIRNWSSLISIADEPTRIAAVRVTSDFFSLLGVQPALGRLFLPEEQQGKYPAVILGHQLWQQFGGSRDLVGKTFELNREPHLVVGIMPRWFVFPDDCQAWFPLPDQDFPDPGNYDLLVIGKLNKDANPSQSRSELDVITARLRAVASDSPAIGVSVSPLQQRIVGDSGRGLVVLLGAVACVLLIACANVANLLLARARRRQREIAVRLALGASRWRVVRSLLIESVLLALVGGLLGVAWAYWSVDLFVALDPLALPRIEEIAVDGMVLLFTFAVAVATGVLFGLAPALRVSHPDLNGALKEGSERQAFAGAGRNRGRSALAIAQIALALVLLTGTGLLLRSFVNRISVPLGFRPEGVISIELPWSAHRQLDEVLERIRGVPGVVSAGAATAYPHGEPGTTGHFAAQGDGETKAAQQRAGLVPVTPGYFRAAGMTLRAGRLFTEADGPDAPTVALINEAVAIRYLPGQNPIGRQVRSADETWRTVVGIVSDAKGFGVDGGPTPTVYVPYRQQSWSNGVYILASTALPPSQVMPAIRAQVREISKTWVIDIDTIENMLSEMVATPRFYMLLVASFAVLAVSIAALGTYGVMSYLVAQRRHEMGIRMMLGADHGHVRSMVLRQGLVLILTGVVVGLAGAWASTRVLESLLFQVHSQDAAAFGGACGLLVLTGLVACYIPARRATRIDPMEALRHE